MKKEYLTPNYEVEKFENEDVILTSGVGKSDNNHSFGGNPDLSI